MDKLIKNNLEIIGTYSINNREVILEGGIHAIYELCDVLVNINNTDSYSLETPLETEKLSTSYLTMLYFNIREGQGEIKRNDTNLIISGSHALMKNMSNRIRGLASSSAEAGWSGHSHIDYLTFDITEESEELIVFIKL